MDADILMPGEKPAMGRQQSSEEIEALRWVNGQA
jgi:hypothetical protein